MVDPKNGKYLFGAVVAVLCLFVFPPAHAGQKSSNNTKLNPISDSNVLKAPRDSIQLGVVPATRMAIPAIIRPPSNSARRRAGTWSGVDLRFHHDGGFGIFPESADEAAEYIEMHQIPIYPYLDGGYSRRTTAVFKIGTYSTETGQPVTSLPPSSADPVELGITIAWTHPDNLVTTPYSVSNIGLSPWRSILYGAVTTLSAHTAYDFVAHFLASYMHLIRRADGTINLFEDLAGSESATWLEDHGIDFIQAVVRAEIDPRNLIHEGPGGEDNNVLCLQLRRDSVNYGVFGLLPDDLDRCLAFFE